MSYCPDPGRTKENRNPFCFCLLQPERLRQMHRIPVRQGLSKCSQKDPCPRTSHAHSWWSWDLHDVWKGHQRVECQLETCRLEDDHCQWPLVWFDEDGRVHAPWYPWYFHSCTYLFCKIRIWTLILDHLWETYDWTLERNLDDRCCQVTISAIDGSEQVTFVATFLSNKRDRFTRSLGNLYASLKWRRLGRIGPGSTKKSCLRVLRGMMEKRRARIVENEQTRSWLIRWWHVQGKWKDYTPEKRRKHLRNGDSQSDERGCGRL